MGALCSVRCEEHDTFASWRARHHRLMSEHVPHNLLTAKRPVRFIGLRADDARVLRPRANSTVLRHLRDPHVILAIIGAKHGTTPGRRVAAAIHSTVACTAHCGCQGKRFAAVAFPLMAAITSPIHQARTVERAVIVGSASPEKPHRARCIIRRWRPSWAGDPKALP